MHLPVGVLAQIFDLIEGTAKRVESFPLLGTAIGSSGPRSRYQVFDLVVRGASAQRVTKIDAIGGVDRDRGTKRRRP